MRIIKFILLLLIFVVISCNQHISSNQTNKGCSDYYRFVRNNLKSKNDIYYFDNAAKYWDALKYGDDRFLNKKCLIGQNNEIIIELFGKPSRIVRNPHSGYFVYCFTKECNALKYSLNCSGSLQTGLHFWFSNDTITTVLSQPRTMYSPMNEVD